MVLRAWVNDDASDPSLLFFTDKTARPGGKIDRGRCSGAEVRFSYRADTATVVIPVSCLPGGPDG